MLLPLRDDGRDILHGRYTTQGLEAPPSDDACALVVRVLGRSPSTASRLQTLLRSGMTAKKPSR